MNNIVLVKCIGNYYKIINKINCFNIVVYDITYKNENIYLKIAKKDFYKLKKYLPNYKFVIERELGFSRLISILRKHYSFLIALIIGFIILFFLSHIIVKVEVVHSSKEIRDLVYNALDDEGIRRLAFKKDYTEINKIKEKILKKYPEDLEWLEIEEKGMKYIIRVEQRVITNKPQEPKSCNIVALKSGVITNILTTNGESLVTRGNYVSKGDILISGNITWNQEIKDVVCAQGSVKAEVWYTVRVSMPLKYEIKHKTGRKRYNIIYDKGLGKTNIFRNRLKTFEAIDTKILSLLGTKYYFRKMEEYTPISKKYSPDEALNAATLLALDKINIKKNDQDKIITQKVLKKELNDSTINLEIFFAIEEEIGKKEIFEISNEVE